MEKILYAILSVKENSEDLNDLLAGIKGISGAGLYSVSVRETSAVVGDIDRNDFKPDRTATIEFAEVIETLSHHFTLLPVRFGAILPSTQAVKTALSTNYTGIRQNLQSVRNKVEFGLKVFCDTENLKAELKTKLETGNKSEDVQSAATVKSVYRSWMDAKLAEYRLEVSLLNYVDAIISDILGSLSRLKTINKIEKLTSTSNIIDAVFLLEKDKKETFVIIVDELQNRYSSLHLMLTGPWPPYNFVDITIK
jgi:hypothetical protein